MIFQDHEVIKYLFHSYSGQNSVQRQESSTSKASTVDNRNSTSAPKLPPRPLDYDQYYYQDEEGNWWNEYDDMGYEFDPNRYEGDPEENSSSEPVPKEAAVKNKDVDSSGGVSELKVLYNIIRK